MQHEPTTRPRRREINFQIDTNLNNCELEPETGGYSTPTNTKAGPFIGASNLYENRGNVPKEYENDPELYYAL